jgi:hypothetical protein
VKFMPRSETDVTINAAENIPIEIIQEASTWQGVMLDNLPFMITVLIVLAAATVTYRSNRNSINSQNDLATEFRHHWIQEVRESSAKTCQVIHEMQTIVSERNIALRNRKQAALNGDSKEEIHYMNIVSSSYSKLIEKRSDFYYFTSKVKLLFKKEEPSTEGLFVLLRKAKDELYDFDKSNLNDEMIDDIISEFQDILKSEWETTKERSWHKTT